MIYAYLSALHVRPLCHRDGAKVIAGAFFVEKRRLPREIGERGRNEVWLRIVDNCDSHLASIRIQPAGKGAALAHIVVVAQQLQPITLFAAIKAIYRYAVDHEVERMTIKAPIDLASAFPALALKREGHLASDGYLMRPREISRRFHLNPHNPVLVYLIAMEHRNISYK